jgi:hypothetical protein
MAELATEYPDAYIASNYADPLVIEGNANLGAELAAWIVILILSWHGWEAEI